MNVNELFRRLSFGELSNLSISGEGSGELAADKHPQIIQYINEGLLRLFTRFNLREKDIVIVQIAEFTSYPLKRRFTVSAALGDPDERFIQDAPPAEPFLEDVIKILEVHDSRGWERILNDKERYDSLFTPAADVLQIPDPLPGVALSVLYQARHEVLRDETVDEELADVLLAQTIDLPFALEGALQAFVAHKVYSHMNGAENLQKSQEYLATADAISREVEDRDTVNQSFATTHHKLHLRGFA